MKSIAALLVTVAAFALTGCNTIQGLGQDIQKGGQVLEGGHHLISLPVAEKPLSEIAAKHRKRTQRKREFKRQVAAASQQAFRSVLA